MTLTYIPVTPGTGRNVGADQIASVDYQVVKIATGAEGNLILQDTLPVSGYSALKDITLTLDTSGAYADGDVLADTQGLTNAFRVNDGVGHLESLVAIDKDDQKQPFEVLFFDANVSLGTENSPPNISDANAAQFLGAVSIGSADYIDLGGVAVAIAQINVAIMLKAASGTTTLYLAARSRGTGTYTASGIVLRIGILQGLV